MCEGAALTAYALQGKAASKKKASSDSDGDFSDGDYAPKKARTSSGALATMFAETFRRDMLAQNPPSQQFTFSPSQPFRTFEIQCIMLRGRRGGLYLWTRLTRAALISVSFVAWIAGKGSCKEASCKGRSLHSYLYPTQVSQAPAGRLISRTPLQRFSCGAVSIHNTPYMSSCDNSCPICKSIIGLPTNSSKRTN